MRKEEARGPVPFSCHCGEVVGTVVFSRLGTSRTSYGAPASGDGWATGKLLLIGKLEKKKERGGDRDIQVANG